MNLTPPDADRQRPDGRSQRKLRGVITAMVTPLTSSGKLDARAFQKLTETQLSAGVDGLFILGSVGEGPQLADATYREVAWRAFEFNSRRVPLLAGASDNSVSRCLKRLECLARCGTEYGVLTLPYYGWIHSEAHSMRFFTEIAARSPIPIAAYNLPKNVGWRMSAGFLEELCTIPNLVAIKDTHDDFEQMVAIAASPRRPAGVSYFPGSSFLAARLLAHGADGLICTPANVFPKPFVDLFRFFHEGRGDLVSRIDDELVSLMKPLLSYLPTGAASIKGLLESRGICRRFTVRPWPEASDADIASMQEILGEIEAATAKFYGGTEQ